MQNYNKDSASRKARRYLLDKVAVFGESFRVINENHEKLKTFASNHQPYFAQDSFGSLKTIYDRVMANIQARLRDFEEEYGENEGASATKGKSGNPIENLWLNDDPIATLSQVKPNALQSNDTTIKF